MRWMPTLAVAGLAELAAYFLSLAWGFAVLTAAEISSFRHHVGYIMNERGGITAGAIGEAG